MSRYSDVTKIPTSKSTMAYVTGMTLVMSTR